MIIIVIVFTFTRVDFSRLQSRSIKKAGTSFSGLPDEAHDGSIKMNDCRLIVQTIHEKVKGTIMNRVGNSFVGVHELVGGESS